MIYKCNYCEHYFTEDEAEQKEVRNFGTHSYSTILVCPECGHDELDELTERDACEEIEYWKDAYSFERMHEDTER